MLLLFSMSLSPYVMADDMEKMEDMSSQLEAINNNLARGQFDGEELVAWTKLTIKMESAASLCVSASEAALLELQVVIDGLGEKVGGEDAEVTKKRNNSLQKKKGWIKH